MPASAGMVASILKRMGVEAPSEGELEELIADGLLDYKKSNGLDPKSTHIALGVHIEDEWIKKRMNAG